MARLSLEERLNRIEDKISEKSFRENKGLGNEVGYYVFDYDPRAELEVRNHIAYLKDRINNGNKEFKIIEFDLFHTMIQVLEEEGYLEAFFALEKDNGFFDMADSLVETLGLDETNEQNLIISKILQENLTNSVIFLTGVGKCHPIIASHNILNLNCQALSLPQTRKNVLMAEKNRIMRKCKGKSQDAFIRELERTYESLMKERNLTPYCGIIISWLEGKLKIS